MENVSTLQKYIVSVFSLRRFQWSLHQLWRDKSVNDQIQRNWCPCLILYPEHKTNPLLHFNKCGNNYTFTNFKNMIIKTFTWLVSVQPCHDPALYTVQTFTVIHPRRYKEMYKSIYLSKSLTSHLTGLVTLLISLCEEKTLWYPKRVDQIHCSRVYFV